LQQGFIVQRVKLGLSELLAVVAVNWVASSFDSHDGRTGKHYQPRSRGSQSSVSLSFIRLFQMDTLTTAYLTVLSGNVAFKAKHFKAAIEAYTEAINIQPEVAAFTYITRCLPFRAFSSSIPCHDDLYST
jgi:hypothetical protein